MIKLETSRLLMRPYIESDRRQFLALNCDPQVRRYMNGELTRKAADKKFNIVLKEQVTNQGACWAITKKITPSYIGHAYMEPSKLHPFHELGFLFLKSFWGRGYGTEAILRLLRYYLDDTTFIGLSASVDCDNTKSIRLLEKTGFNKERVAVDNDGPFFIYSIKRKHGGKTNKELEAAGK
jgi:RimJ/RimL family protein N-acetyltransferase